MAEVPRYTMPKEQASALLSLALLLPFAKTRVGLSGRQGIRMVFFWRCAVESYTCFQEPVLEPWHGIRIVFWKTEKEVVASRRWRRFRGIPIGNTYAIARVHEKFLEDWSPNARRCVTNAKERLSSKEVSLQEFGVAYHASGYLDPFLRYGFLKVIKDHMRVHPQDVTLLFFFTTTGELAGGTVFVDYPDVRQSHYLISFLTDAGRTEKAGYEFIWWWYQDMLKKGLIWADFGIVWAPGDPVSWKGYSQFKERFHPKLYSRVTYWRWAKKDEGTGKKGENML